MEPGARPDAVPRWGASSTMVQPPDGEAAAGFATGSRPPAEWLNWMFNRHGAWIDFLRGPNVESWTRLAVAGTELDSATYRRFAIDTANPQVTDAFRFVLLGELTSTSEIRVSKTGDEWVTRSTHAPAGLTALGVTATNWLLGDDTGALYYGAIDDGTGTGPIGSDSTAWSTATGTVSGTVREFASNGSRVFCVSAGGGAYSDDDGATWATYSVSGTARSGDGWSTVYDGARWLFTTQSAQVYASSDGASFAYKATFSGTSTPWFLAVGAPGEVVAYRYHTASAAMYRSTDGGATWTTLTPSSTLKPIKITRLRYASGQWVATSDVAPYLWTSNDLVAWHPLRVPVSGSASKALGAVAWDGSAWWAVGRSMALRCARAADSGGATYNHEDGATTHADAAYLRGLLVSDATPADGEVLTWSDSLQQWVPAAGGGGGSVASTDITDSTSTGRALLTATNDIAAAAIINGARRWAADADTLLLWELNEASGDFANSGSLGAAGDLTAGAGIAHRAFKATWPLVRGARCNGSSGSDAKGAAGCKPTSGTAVTAWAVIVPEGGSGKRAYLTRDLHTPGSWASPWVSLMMCIDGSNNFTAEINDGTSYRAITYSPSLVTGQCYFVGLTYDGTTLKLYVDGVLVQSGSYSGSIDWGDADAIWHVSSHDTNIERFTGTVLRAGVENLVWSASEFKKRAQLINGTWGAE